MILYLIHKLHKYLSRNYIFIPRFIYLIACYIHLINYIGAFSTLNSWNLVSLIWFTALINYFIFLTDSLTTIDLKFLYLFYVPSSSFFSICQLIYFKVHQLSQLFLSDTSSKAVNYSFNLQVLRSFSLIYESCFPSARTA